MANQFTPILSDVRPLTSGCYFEPSSIKLVNDLVDNLVLIFDDTAADEEIAGRFKVPENYVDSATVVLDIFTEATSGSISLGFKYRAITDAESADPSTFQQDVQQAVTVPGTAREIERVTFTLTDGNFSAGDIVEFILYRENTDGVNDTLADEVVLLPASTVFRYADA